MHVKPASFAWLRKSMSRTLLENNTSHLVEETLVVDERASRRPAEAVEQKLCQMLGIPCIGVSQLRLKDLLSARALKK